MKGILIVVCLLLISSCKKQEASTANVNAAQSTQPASTFTAFERATNQYLIDTKAVKKDCTTLFTRDYLKAINNDNKPIVCGEMTLGLDATRQMLDIAHGHNQQSAWDGDQVMTSGIFGIDDGVVMPVLLLGEQNAIVMLGE